MTADPVAAHNAALAELDAFEAQHAELYRRWCAYAEAHGGRVEAIRALAGPAVVAMAKDWPLRVYQSRGYVASFEPCRRGQHALTLHFEHGGRIERMTLRMQLDPPRWVNPDAATAALDIEPADLIAHLDRYTRVPPRFL